MNFFKHQEQAKSNSFWLVVLFIIAIVALVGMSNFIGWFALVLGGGNPFNLEEHGRYFLWISIGTAAFILILSFYKIYVLSLQGGISIALSLNGKNVPPQSQLPEEQRLMNIVEEMSIASGVPMPEVFILDGESINAFAAGYGVKDAVIGVTEGALQQLDRDELQGVIAHEFSHILNGDMRLNMRIVGVLHGIMAMSTIGRLLMGSTSGGYRSSRRRGRGGGGQIILIGFLIWIAGSLGAFFGKLIQAAISREREFLADASAVQFTRNPSGIGGALRKILAQNRNHPLSNLWASEFNHFFITSPKASSFFSFDTHPKLENRIRKIYSLSENQKIDLPALKSATKANVSAHKSAGTTLDKAQTLLGLITPFTQQQIKELYSVRGVVYALFLSKDPYIRDSQIQTLQKHNQQSLSKVALRVFNEIESQIEQMRLPLLELSLPTLKNMTSAQKAQFLNLLETLIQEDGKVEVYEYAYRKILYFFLSPTDKLTHRAKPTKDDARWAFYFLLTATAKAGTSDPQQAAQTLQRICKEKGLRPLDFNLEPPTDLQEFDKALEFMAACSLNARQLAVETLVSLVTADQNLLAVETELVRAISLVLGIPLPRLAKAS